MSNEFQSADTIDQSFVPCVRRNVDSLEIEGELLLFDESQGSWHLLNPAATIVWTVADAKGSIADLASDIAEFSGGDREAVLADVLAIVRDFGRRGLLEGVQGGVAHTHDHDHAGATGGDHAHHTEPGETGAASSTGLDPTGRPQPRFLAVPPSS